MYTVFDFQFYMMMVIFMVFIPLGTIYAPWIIRKTIQYLDKNYPRDQYPGVISISPKVLIGLTYLDIFIGVITMLALVFSLLFWQPQVESTFIQEFYPFNIIESISIYLFVRAILWIVLGVKGARYLGSLKPPMRRSATFQAVKITDYISPISIVLSLVLTTAAFLIISWWIVIGANVHPVSWIVCVVLAFSLIMKSRQIIHGPNFRRIDPFVSHEDLFRQRQAQLRLQFGSAFIWIPILLIIIAPTGIQFSHALNFSLFCIFFNANFSG